MAEDATMKAIAALGMQSPQPKGIARSVQAFHEGFYNMLPDQRRSDDVREYYEAGCRAREGITPRIWWREWAIGFLERFDPDKTATARTYTDDQLQERITAIHDSLSVYAGTMSQDRCSACRRKKSQ